MAHIAEHNSEKEWESNDSKDSRVNFFMHGNTIGINDLLENLSKVIRFNVGRRLYVMIFKSLQIS
jgi:hypothetical protein